MLLSKLIAEALIVAIHVWLVIAFSYAGDTIASVLISIAGLMWTGNLCLTYHVYQRS